MVELNVVVVVDVVDLVAIAEELLFEVLQIRQVCRSISWA
jgi:hypothetical protein